MRKTQVIGCVQTVFMRADLFAAPPPKCSANEKCWMSTEKSNAMGRHKKASRAWFLQLLAAHGILPEACRAHIEKVSRNSKSKKSPAGSTEGTPKPEYIMLLRGVPFNFWWTEVLLARLNQLLPTDFRPMPCWESRGNPWHGCQWHQKWMNRWATKKHWLFYRI